MLFMLADVELKESSPKLIGLGCTSLLYEPCSAQQTLDASSDGVSKILLSLASWADHNGRGDWE